MALRAARARIHKRRKPALPFFYLPYKNQAGLGFIWRISAKQLIPLNYLYWRTHRASDHWVVDVLGAPHVGERPEKELITSFVNRIAELNPQLVTFNGTSFDLLVLRYRAMTHSVAAPVSRKTSRGQLLARHYGRVAAWPTVRWAAR
jgi:Predicted 3'-5' exonuclease related to the exonuclease domain of PolB